jgi:hypothetical protein
MPYDPNDADFQFDLDVETEREWRRERRAEIAGNEPLIPAGFVIYFNEEALAASKARAKARRSNVCYECRGKYDPGDLDADGVCPDCCESFADSGFDTITKGGA